MCKFGGGVSCKLDVTADAPAKGESHVVRIEWDGLDNGKFPKKRARRLMRDYIAWMNEVNQHLANEWKMRLMHIYQKTAHPSGWQSWIYSPGERPKLV